MEMYPQKRFAPGRRRINAAHHVLTIPIWTFSLVRVFLYFLCFICHVRVRATFVFSCFHKLMLSRD